MGVPASVPTESGQSAGICGPTQTSDGNVQLCDDARQPKRVAKRAFMITNFSKGETPAILYLWKKAEEFNFVLVVCQMIAEGSAVDTAIEIDNDEENNGRRKRRRKGKANDKKEDEGFGRMEDIMER